MRNLVMIQDKEGFRLVWRDGEKDELVEIFPSRPEMSRRSRKIAADQECCQLYSLKKDGTLREIKLKKKKLPKQLGQALEFVRFNGGKLCRYRGGCWMLPGVKPDSHLVSSEALEISVWFPWKTIKALIDLKLMQATKFRQNASGTFPDEVTLV